MSAATSSAAAAAPPLLLLSEAAVRASLTVREALHINAHAFLAAADTQQAQVPEYVAITQKDADGDAEAASVTLFKAALLDAALGVKVVAVRQANARAGLPTVPAVILLNDRATGFPIALVQATYLTALRTAAGSAAATDCFARADASILAVFGAGMQASSHIEAIIAVRPITTVHIINRSAARALELVTALQSTYPAVRFVVHATEAQGVDGVAALKAALRSAHVLCTTTGSKTPLLHAEDVSPGAHINAVGSYLPDMHELDSQLVASCRIAVDCSAATHAGDLATPLAAGLIREEDLHPLGRFIDRERFSKPFSSSEQQVGFTLQTSSAAAKLRQNDSDITLFKSVGTAIQDVATAYAVLQRARQLGLGRVAQWD